MCVLRTGQQRGEDSWLLWVWLGALRGEGAQSRACPPRCRSGVSISHLSDRYKAESSRMNLVGNRAEKGPGAAAGGSSMGATGVGALRDRQRGSHKGSQTRKKLALGPLWPRCSCLYTGETGPVSWAAGPT